VYPTYNFIEHEKTDKRFKRMEDDEIETEECSSGDCLEYLNQMIVTKPAAVDATTKEQVFISAPSYETEAPAGSLIVVEQNGSEAEVLRWSLSNAGVPAFDKVFKTSKFAAVDITGIFVFDEYAFVLVDAKQVYVIFFKAYRGKSVPLNYQVKLDASGTVKHMAIGSHEGTKSELYLAIETIGSLQMYSYSVSVDVDA